MAGILLMKIDFLGVKGNVKVSALVYSKHSGVLFDGKILFDLVRKNS
jgi:hypothetical protein